jgi:tetratricopeptide (TPR) repeat protein
MKRRLLTVALVLAACGFSLRVRGGSAPVVTFYTHEGATDLYRRAKYSEAEAMCKQAISDIVKARGNKSYLIAEPLIDLATIYMRQARYADVKQVLDRAEGLLDKTMPDHALLYGRLGINKGWRLYELGETAAAIKVGEEAREVLEKNSKGDSVDLAEIINNLGLFYEEKGEREVNDGLIRKGRICLLRAFESRMALTGRVSPETGESLNNLGMHLLYHFQSGDEVDLAMSLLKKSLEMAAKVYGDTHPDTASCHAALALALYLDSDIDGAEKEIRLALPITQRYLGDRHPEAASELTTLGMILLERKEYDEAEKDFLQALDIEEDIYGKTHPRIIPGLERLGNLYLEKGDTAKERDMRTRIQKLSGKEM